MRATKPGGQRGLRAEVSLVEVPSRVICCSQTHPRKRRGAPGPSPLCVSLSHTRGAGGGGGAPGRSASRFRERGAGPGLHSIRSTGPPGPMCAPPPPLGRCALRCRSARGAGARARARARLFSRVRGRPPALADARLGRAWPRGQGVFRLLVGPRASREQRPRWPLLDLLALHGALSAGEPRPFAWVGRGHGLGTGRGIRRARFPTRGRRAWVDAMS